MGITSKVKVVTEVKNVPPNPRQYIVARTAEGHLWYYQSWDDIEKAKLMAELNDGIVVEVAK